MRFLLAASLLLGCSSAEERPLKIQLRLPEGGLIELRVDLLCKELGEQHARVVAAPNYKAHCVVDR